MGGGEGGEIGQVDRQTDRHSETGRDRQTDRMNVPMCHFCDTCSIVCLQGS